MLKEQDSDDCNYIDDIFDNYNNDDEEKCSCIKQNYFILKVFYFFYFVGFGVVVLYLFLFYK